MAAFNLSSPTHSSAPSLRISPKFYPSRNAPTLSFYSLRSPSVASASLIHKSLHNYRRRSVIVSALKKLSETEVVAVSSESDGIFPSDSGVYAVYDGSGDLQFVGITRNLAASIITHKKSVPELCSSVKLSLTSN